MNISQEEIKEKLTTKKQKGRSFRAQHLEKGRAGLNDPAHIPNWSH